MCTVNNNLEPIVFPSTLKRNKILQKFQRILTTAVDPDPHESGSRMGKFEGKNWKMQGKWKKIVILLWNIN